MSTAETDKKTELVQTAKMTAIDAMASRLQVSPEILKSTLLKTAFKACTTNEEFVAAVIVANTYKLNPLLKEMTVFASSGNVTPIVMIDGWIKLTNTHPSFNGVELVENEGNSENKSGTTLKSVTAKFYIKGCDHPVVVTEYMDECFVASKEPWKKWPRRMLRHKAFIQGARIAFGFSGIYDDDEADRIIDIQVNKPGQTSGDPEKKDDKAQKPSYVTMGKANTAQVQTDAPKAQETPKTTPQNDQATESLKVGMEKSRKAINERLGEKKGDEFYFNALGAFGYESFDEIPTNEKKAKFLAELITKTDQLEINTAK